MVFSSMRFLTDFLFFQRLLLPVSRWGSFWFVIVIVILVGFIYGSSFVVGNFHTAAHSTVSHD